MVVAVRLAVARRVLARQPGPPHQPEELDPHLPAPPHPPEGEEESPEERDPHPPEEEEEPPKERDPHLPQPPEEEEEPAEEEEESPEERDPPHPPEEEERDPSEEEEEREPPELPGPPEPPGEEAEGRAVVCLPAPPPAGPRSATPSMHSPNGGPLFPSEPPEEGQAVAGSEAVWWGRKEVVCARRKGQRCGARARRAVRR